MTKSELVEALFIKQIHLQHRDVELSVNVILDALTKAMTRKERIEVRGFGSFSLRVQPARIGRNPRTGEAVQIKPTGIPRFKAGKELRERVIRGHLGNADTVR